MESAHPTPRHLGDFEIIREIGRGGMGVVYEARQKSLNRHVALKVLSSGLGLTERAVVRFRREAEAAAKLHHTNIVPIYATGEEHGIHFYAMELIEGPSLDQVIRHLRDGNPGPSSTPEVDSTIDSPVPTVLPDWVAATMAHTSSGGLSHRHRLLAHTWQVACSRCSCRVRTTLVIDSGVGLLENDIVN